MRKKYELQIGDVLLAIDPGLTTGCALGKYEGGRDFTLLQCFALTWEQTPWQLHIAIGTANIVVWERFSLYKDKAKAQINSEFPSSQVIGMALMSIAIYEHQGDKKHVLVQPANERRFVQILPQHLAMVKGSAHTRDAYQHLRYAILYNRPVSRST